ncbi:tyrosine-type recombinase/integrase [Hazenella sp. IB182353]|uniref:tyrosine-type recombinase/integrase n=1 Tax=Polycladospora coralii TaxID=2771432 RepID=UPI0017476AB4|nr:site-specific integrase [Polycladospora coralii]MBS7531175.1 tyrosine-type recombinase/integrase [Polycladospora coralii]
MDYMGHYLKQFTPRKKKERFSHLDDSLTEWGEEYLTLAVEGIRGEDSLKKIALHLKRFIAFYENRYGHDQISKLIKRDLVDWQKKLLDEGLARSTVNNHLASVSGFTSWVHRQQPDLFYGNDPAKGIGELELPPLKVRALSQEQITSLKSLCDRLESYYWLKGRKANRPGQERQVKKNGRPWRDRAIIFTLLSTGLRRAELVGLDLNQLQPNDANQLRSARKACLTRVLEKGKTEREVYLSYDARQALADYIEKERVRDASEEATALFLTASSLSARKTDGRMSKDSLNDVCLKVGKWHDGETNDTEKHISPLKPHDLRHTFAVQLAQELAKQKGAVDPYELERRLGHRSDRYIKLYTNPPEEVAAGYVEEL